jgi:hypothetical protein
MKRFGKDSCELIGHAMVLLSVRCLQVQHGVFIGGVLMGGVCTVRFPCARFPWARFDFEDNSKRLQRYHHKTDYATEINSPLVQQQCPLIQQQKPVIQDQ